MVDEGFIVGGPVGDFELLLCHGTVCVVGKMRDLILQLSKSSIYSTKPQITPLTLESIAKWPLITYRQGITGRSRIDDAFARKGLLADIVLSAQDSDVIKTYVALGLGIGLVAEQSSGAQEEENLIRLDTRHLFDANTVWLGLKRGQLQRNYVWRFLELCNAGLSVEDIKRQVMESSEEEIDYQI